MSDTLRRQIDSLVEQIAASGGEDRDWLVHRLREATASLENLGEEVPDAARDLLRGGQDGSADSGSENFPV